LATQPIPDVGFGQQVDTGRRVHPEVAHRVDGVDAGTGCHFRELADRPIAQPRPDRIRIDNATHPGDVMVTAEDAPMGLSIGRFGLTDEHHVAAGVG
jgi:hypothetical protein